VGTTDSFPGTPFSLWYSSAASLVIGDICFSFSIYFESKTDNLFFGSNKEKIESVNRIKTCPLFRFYLRATFKENNRKPIPRKHLR
jgi:hypothetical protein